MSEPAARDVFAEFRALLDTEGVTEPQIQSQMERDTELIPIVDILGHGLSWGAVISKFEIDRSRKTDFAFITKNTAKWCVTFIELERPQKPLFTESHHANFTVELHAAIAQVEDWRTYVEKHPEEVRGRLRPLMHFHPRFTENPVEFRYVLVIGRWPHDDPYPSGISDRVHRLDRDSKITLMTYDTLMRSQGEFQLGEPKNILAHHRDTFRFKHACADTSMFAHYKPQEITVDEAARQFFADRGYDMDAWKEGKLLELGHRLPAEKTDEAVARALGKPATRSGD